MKRFLAIVVIPKKTSEVKKFKISIQLLSLLILVSIGFLSGIFWVYYDFFSIKNEQFDISSLQREVSSGEKNLERFSEEYRELDSKYNLLRNDAQKLKRLSEVRVKDTNDSQNRQILKKIKQNPSLSILDVIQSQEFLDSPGAGSSKRKQTKLIDYLSENVNLFNRIPSQWPVRGFVISGFGFKTDPFSDQTNQNGIVIATQPNLPVLAPAEGIVTKVEETENFGKMVTLYHTNNLVTKYGFLSKVNVEFGDRLQRDEPIGVVGSSKKVNAPQLYYEISINGIPRNPVQYIQSE